MVSKNIKIVINMYYYKNNRNYPLVLKIEEFHKIDFIRYPFNNIKQQIGTQSNMSRVK